MGELNSAVSELWTNYHAHYPDPARPVHSTLIKSYTERLAQFMEVAPSSGGLADWQAVLPELTKLSSELKEIGSYLGENPLYITAPPGKVGEFLSEQGFSFPDARDTVELTEKIPRGRPQTVRILAVQALEMKKFQKKSWRAVAIKLCPCGKDMHGPYCSERIRHAVIALQEILQKYEIAPS